MMRRADDAVGVARDSFEVSAVVQYSIGLQAGKSIVIRLY